MKRRSFLSRSWAALAAAAGALFSAPRAGAMGGGMMGGGMGGMMSSDNMRGPMRTGMALFMRHAQVERSVSDIPGGVRAETTSRIAETAALIQQHVADMYQRLDENRPFPYPASPSVGAMFAHSRAYTRKLEALPNGVAVIETSNDSEMVRVIRAHAREITGFVKEGMPAMMRGMMGR